MLDAAECALDEDNDEATAWAAIEAVAADPKDSEVAAALADELVGAIIREIENVLSVSLEDSTRA